MRRRLSIVLGVAALFLGAFTALDKYDESSCRKSPSAHVTVPRPSDEWRAPCEGFLPW